VSKALLLSFSLASLALVLTLAAPGSAQSQSSGTGSIQGVVTFKGTPPERKVIDASSDAACATKKELSDTVIVNKGKLQDVHVRIKSGSAGKHKAPTTPVVVHQEGCVYRPHVIGAMVGQPVAIKNKDKTMHNVHAYIGTETWFNRSQPKGAPDIVETDTGEAGEVFELKCNVHSWMHSYLPITDHPYFDVSSSDGSFEIKKVPAGTYTLEAWHPKYGLKTSKIVVGKGTTKASFQFP
jgi:plastocyanin